MQTHIKIFPEINFMYLGNKEIYCISQTCKDRVIMTV